MTQKHRFKVIYFSSSACSKIITTLQKYATEILEFMLRALYPFHCFLPLIMPLEALQICGGYKVHEKKNDPLPSVSMNDTSSVIEK